MALIILLVVYAVIFWLIDLIPNNTRFEREQKVNGVTQKDTVLVPYVGAGKLSTKDYAKTVGTLVDAGFKAKD